MNTAPGTSGGPGIIKIVVVSVVVPPAVSGILYFFFRNYRQESQVKRFFESLAAGNYQAAYVMWVSTDASARLPVGGLPGGLGPAGRRGPQLRYPGRGVLREQRDRGCRPGPGWATRRCGSP